MSELSLPLNTKFKPYLLLICGFEIVFLLLMVKSISMSIVFASLITCTIFLFIYPEFSLAVALTGNILLSIIFDHFHVNIPIPVIIAYILLLGSSAIFVAFQQTPGRKIHIGKLIYITIAIWFLMIFSLSYSGNRSYGLEKVAFFLLFNVALISLPLLFRENLEKIRNIFIFTFLLGIILGIVTTFIALNASSYARFQPSESVNSIWLARSLGVSIIAGAVLFIRVHRRMLKLLLLAILPFFIYPMLETGSRAPFLGLVGSLLLIFLLQPAQPLSRKIKVTIIAMVLAFGYLAVSSSTVSARISDPNTVDVFSAVSRFAAWAQSFKDFMNSPLLGIGTGSFELDLFWLTFTYPHNLFLELACETGIIGLILICVFVFLSIKYGLRNIKNYHQNHLFLPTQLSIISLAIFVYALWNSMFSGDIQHNEIIWFGAGLIWVLHISVPSQTENVNREDS